MREVALLLLQPLLGGLALGDVHLDPDQAHRPAELVADGPAP
jgi:hypothetical protein